MNLIAEEYFLPNLQTLAAKPTTLFLKYYSKIKKNCFVWYSIINHSKLSTVRPSFIFAGKL